jgi:DNA polymerase-1
MQPEKNLLIFDISSHFHRAYESVRYRIGKDEPNPSYNGNPNHMIEMVKVATNMVQSEMRKLNVRADYVVCVLDASGENFRHRMYPAYKGTRPPSDATYDYMRDCAAKIMQLKGFHLITHPDVEADDVIATLATKVKPVKGLKTYICTGDKDMFYLIDDKTLVFAGAENANKGKLYDTQGCFDKKGVMPNQINDYLVLDGDDVDNVIGVPNVGPVKAQNMLKHFTLNEILENPELLEQEKVVLRGKNKIISYIKENKDFMQLMQKVVQMKEDLKLNVSLKNFIRQQENTEGVNQVFNDLELNGSLEHFVKKYDNPTSEALRKAYTT